MLKRFAAITGFTLLLGMIVVPAADAQTRFSIQIGPGYGSYAPGPGYYWQDGYNSWTGYGYSWIPGRWVRPYGGRYRVNRRWDRGGYYRNWDNRGRYRDRGWNGGRDRGGNRDYDRGQNDRGNGGRR